MLETERSRLVDVQNTLETERSRLVDVQNMLKKKDETVKKLGVQVEEYVSKNEQLQNTLEKKDETVKTLEVQVERYKKIEELRVSSSHISEYIKYQRDAEVHMIPPISG